MPPSQAAPPTASAPARVLCCHLMNLSETGSEQTGPDILSLLFSQSFLRFPQQRTPLELSLPGCLQALPLAWCQILGLRSYAAVGNLALSGSPSGQQRVDKVGSAACLWASRKLGSPLSFCRVGPACV